LFDAESLLAEQRARGVAIGVASSVPTRMWEAARTCPPAAQSPLRLSADQVQLLDLFQDLIRS